MQTETSLMRLLRSMAPVLRDEEHGYGHVPGGQMLPPGLVAFATVAEAEGLTVIAPVDALARHGIHHIPGWALISLTVHSDLAAVGLTAVVATALAAGGLSANVVAGYFHDHVLVPWPRRQEAMAILAGLAAAS